MNVQTKQKVRETVAYFESCFAELKGAKGRPFFRVRLDAAQAGSLIQRLEQCAGSRDREWFTLTSTHDKPERLRLTQPTTPNYEMNAAPVYLRGDAVRISGDRGSCNINFSGSVGGALLAERLRMAREKMRRFLEIRIPSRTWNLIEFIADIDLEAMESPEHRKLALTGGILAAELWGEEDFSDWETQDA